MRLLTRDAPDNDGWPNDQTFVCDENPFKCIVQRSGFAENPL